MQNWYMLTLVGADRSGIVSRLTAVLYAGGANLGEASMIRLGGNFSIMLMVGFAGTAATLAQLVEPVSTALGLHIHVDAIEGQLHKHVVPDVRVTVFGADRPGIVAGVTGALAETGLNIVDLQSDVAGTAAEPVYVMHIEGQAQESIETLRSAVAAVTGADVEVEIESIETMVG